MHNRPFKSSLPTEPFKIRISHKGFLATNFTLYYYWLKYERMELKIAIQQHDELTIAMSMNIRTVN